MLLNVEQLISVDRVSRRYDERQTGYGRYNRFPPGADATGHRSL